MSVTRNTLIAIAAAVTLGAAGVCGGALLGKESVRG